ncbi:Release factor glutamine methyltransferase [bioreactor metagenome]|uniref:Release factor glutamine methyltransferase n=1 Tax=bioreactor metagenome TaxID=1076179 RepID=A0A645IMW2_9ZZZZ
MALDGGEDGLDFYRIIIKEGRKFLREDGLIFFEIGHDQKEAVCGLLELGGYSQVNTIKDLAGLDRVVFGRKIER